MDDPPAIVVGAEDLTSQSAMAHTASHLRFWLVAVATLAVDLWSKSWVFRDLGPREERPFLSGIIVFRRSLNDGAVFGSFTGYVGLFIVASVVALGFVFYLFTHTQRSHHVMHVALALILAGALGNLYDRSTVRADVVRYTTRFGNEASAIGTIIPTSMESKVLLGDWPDGGNPQAFWRKDVTTRRQGVVRDFIKFAPKFPDWVPRLGGRDIWPWVFNVADSALVCGVGALLLTSWRRPTARRAHKRGRDAQVP